MPLICSTLFNLGGVVAGPVYYTPRDYELVFYQQVHAIATVQAYAFVLNWLRMLRFKLKAIQFELMRKTLFIG
jgi:hypothetical protein